MYLWHVSKIAKEKYFFVTKIKFNERNKSQLTSVLKSVLEKFVGNFINDVEMIGWLRWIMDSGFADFDLLIYSFVSGAFQNKSP